MKKIIIPIIGSFCLLLALWQLFGRQSRSLRVCKECNVILISVDTLRADHVGAYGYSRPTTPTVDAFARDAVLFKTAIAHAPSTATSHASIFTSLVPASHGAFGSRSMGITDGAPTIAEIFKEHGFATASFNGGGQLHGPSGFARGFDVHEKVKKRTQGKDFFVDRVREGAAWMKQLGDKRFFLFLHSYEVHTPYNPAEKYRRILNVNYQGDLPRRLTASFLSARQNAKKPLSREDRDYIVDLYDGGIRSMDDGFAELIQFLKEAKLYEKTMIVFVSDHGEELGERGMYGFHVRTLYDELLKVPLIVKFPHGQFAGRKVDTQVRGIDILPTVLESVGIESLPHFHGRTLTAALQGEEFPRFAISQRDTKKSPVPTSVRTQDWKATRQALHDLKKDPGEHIDVARRHAQVHGELRQVIEALPQPPMKGEDGKGDVIYDSETLKQLKTLGYL